MVSIIMAALFAALGILFITRPLALTGWFAAFPRHKPLGIILTGVALLWSAMLINQMTLGELSKYKFLLYLLTPLSFFLIIHYLDELLAARSFGGLLLLVPTVMVDAARWHPSEWRLVVVTLGYIMVIIGTWLVLSPFKFRVWTSWLMEHGVRQKIAAFTCFGVSFALMITFVVAR
jgi:hypothetical protein